MSASAGWHAKELGDALMAHVELAAIESAVLAAQRDQPEKSGRAVFTRYDSEGRLQCAVTAYFSPAAAALANEFQAVPVGRLMAFLAIEPWSEASPPFEASSAITGIQSSSSS